MLPANTRQHLRRGSSSSSVAHGLLLLLLLLLALGPSQRGGSAAADDSSDQLPSSATINTSSEVTYNQLVNKTHRTVCVWPYAGMDICGIDGTVDSFTGYEPEIFKRLASRLFDQGELEWAPGAWSFTCVTDAPISHLIKLVANGTCDCAVGGITADEVATSSQVKLSYPYLTNGRRILLFRPTAPELWEFLDPFERSIWLLLFGSAVAVALSIQVLEASWSVVCAPRRVLTRRDSGSSQGLEVKLIQGTWWGTWQRYSSLQWSSLSFMFLSVHHLTPRSPGARLVLLGAGFTALILACMYTSSYAATMSVNRLKDRITSMSDLIYLPVGIYEGDALSLSNYQLSDQVLLPWSGAVDEGRMLQALRNGTVSALVLDAALVDYYAALDCDLYQVGALVNPSSTSLMYATAVPDAYAELVSSTIQDLLLQEDIGSLVKTYIHPQSSCEPPATLAYPQIDLQDIGGLWILLAACMGLGLVWNLLLAAARLMSPPVGPQPPGRSPTSCPPLPGAAAPSSKRAPVSLESRANSKAGTAAGMSRSLGGSQEEPATTEEALQLMSARLEQLEDIFAQLPEALSLKMDDRLTILRIQLATIITSGALRPASSMRDSTQGLDHSGSGLHAHKVSLQEREKEKDKDKYFGRPSRTDPPGGVERFLQRCHTTGGVN